MKKVLTSLLAVSSAAVLMTSCKKQSLETPDATPSETNTAAVASRSGGGLILAPVYTLTKRGADTLTYYADGRLGKVQHSPTRFTQYNYGFNTITASTFTGSQLDQKIIYQTDVQTGRVFESEEHKYSYLSPSVTYHDQKWYKFEYNADGRLIKKYNKNNPVERTEFLWGWGGASLANIRRFDKNGSEFAKVEFANVWNKSALRLQQPATGLDIYLNIFGKPNKDLPSIEYHYSIKNGAATQTAKYAFYYTNNNDDYPVLCKVYNAEANPYQLLETVPFAYSVK